MANLSDDASATESFACERLPLRRKILLFSAKFEDPATEDRYREYLAEVGGGRQRMLQSLGALVFALYGILDALVVGEFAKEFLIARLVIAAPLAFGIMALSWIPKFKRYSGLTTAIALIVIASAIIYMTYRMRAPDSPPYIIGLLVVLVYTSCLMRIDFRTAAFVYTIIGVVYCAALLSKNANYQESVSGVFFMISVASVATVTNYLQERQARDNWYKDEQQNRDAELIRRLLVEATAADRSKINFLSIVTHELRTPLHQIIGYSEVVREASREVENSNYLDQIIHSAKDLLKKLGKVLRYADASAGKLKVQLEPCDIRDVVELAADQLASDAASKSVKINYKGLQTTEILADLHLASYAIQNLIENAITASPPGGVIEITGAPSGENEYLVEISDHGCGMTADQLKFALSPFQQAEAGLSRSSEGLGLGLPIAQRLLLEQNARMDLSSNVNEGTTARIRFKRRAETQRAADRAA